MFFQTLVVSCMLASIKANEPQVYENSDDLIQMESNTRVVRDPSNQQRPKIHTPPIFDYQAASQQDQRKNRYAQQQLADMANIIKRGRKIHQEAPLRVSLVQNWQAVDPIVSSSKDNYRLSEEDKNSTSSQSVWSRISQLTTTKKPVTSRKLAPTSYFDDLEGKVATKRQDHNSQLVYLHPDVIKQQFQRTPGSDRDLNALNALVGQNPNTQLEGLKKLLESSQSHYMLPPIKGPLPFQAKDHTPIVEQTLDIPNPRSRPNINLEQDPSLEALQSQLDEAAKIQLQKALEDAQQQAMAQVEAQHRAIAKAQVDAQRKALAQIALHNQGIKGESLPQPLALQREVPVIQYAPSHSHQAQNVVEVPNLEKISVTKTQGHRSPNTYQQVVLETQHQDPPGLNHEDRDDDDQQHQQYAARYAFGYKIRDAKMGNDFGHEEKRDGENANGHYHVLLPDGRVQKVEYYADPTGYHAKVTYENLAHH